MGVDLSPEMIEKGIARGCYDSVCVGDVESFMRSVRPSTVDFIAACDVFVYLGDLSVCF